MVYTLFQFVIADTQTTVDKLSKTLSEGALSLSIMINDEGFRQGEHRNGTEVYVHVTAHS